MRLPQTLPGNASYLPRLFLAAVAIVTALALMPHPAIPQVFDFWDKAQHALAYTVLAALGCGAYPSRTRHVALGLLAHGALIEVLQGTLTTTRYADVNDWFADAIGASLGMLLIQRVVPVVALIASRIRTRV